MTGLARKEGLVLGRANPDEGAPAVGPMTASPDETPKEPRP